MPVNLEPSQIQLKIFQRLSDFVALKNISMTQFWTSNRACLSLDEFQQLLDAINFKLTQPQIQKIQLEEIQFINLDALIFNVQVWKNQVHSVSNFFMLQKQEAQQRKVADKQKRAKTGKFQLKIDRAASRTTQTFKSRAVSKQLQAELQLSEKLIKAKNESDYELIIKVGEANDLCKKLKKKVSYVINSENDKVKILQIGDKNEEIIKTHNAFEKEYEQLKRQMLNKGQQIEGTLEQDLKKTLVQIMYASDQLQRQIKLLERKGIGH